MGGIGAIAVLAPSAVAAAGLYFLDRYHYHAAAITQVVGDYGLNGLHSSTGNLVAKVKGDEKKVARPIPKFAPEFDGLHCFETLVMMGRH
ncbi:hypothetical protein ACH5RR_017297 [Cinchona calisaya]|uniref:Oleosin n=1 Tax=Cinchona calisaya TaxID=153742 RepID=A0ABD3A421_9GENT